MGSLYLEENQWRLIALKGTGSQSCLWTSHAPAVTWHLEKQLTYNSVMNHTYARSPVNAHPDFYAFWADGNARQLSESNLYFCNQVGEMFLLPAQMDDIFGKAILVPTKMHLASRTTSWGVPRIPENNEGL